MPIANQSAIIILLDETCWGLRTAGLVASSMKSLSGQASRHKLSSLLRGGCGNAQPCDIPGPEAHPRTSPFSVELLPAAPKSRSGTLTDSAEPFLGCGPELLAAAAAQILAVPAADSRDLFRKLPPASWVHFPFHSLKRKPI